MPTWDFDAARRERLRARDPISFTLGGEQFTCLPVIPLGVAWALADAPDQAELLQQTTPQVLHGLAGLVADMLILGDVDRWWALFQSKEEVIDEDAIYELVQTLTAAYTGRPTSPSIDSSDGRSKSGVGSKRSRSKRVSESSAT